MYLILFLSAVLFAINLTVFSIIKRIGIASEIALIITMIIFSYTYIDPGVSKISMMWTLIFPLMAFYFKGKTGGAVHIAVLLFIGIAAFISDASGIIPTNYAMSAYLFTLSELIVISLMTFFYEDTFTRNEKIIIRQIYTDPLTGLQNRKKLINVIAKSGEYRLILINVDGFKEINNIYGSKIGDDIIVEISDRIKKNTDSHADLYKLHADEFAIIVDKDVTDDYITTLAKKIDMTLSTDFFIRNHEVTISVSMGISDASSDILSEADIALKLAKEKRVSYFFFDSSIKLKEKYQNNLLLLNKLKNGIAKDNIIPFYQPIINNKTLKIEKYECLTRLFYEDEIITPFLFLDLAKRSKIYPHITRIMILKAFEYFQEMDVEFSINLSIDDILNRDTINFIFNSLGGYKNTKNVVFEIVESEKIEKYEEIIEFINRAKKYKCKIAIDDFGSGYSNFDYILKMNVDYLKIDSSLIKKIDTDTNSMTITETIASFCRKLNLKTIAEFVHSESVFNKVKELEIDYSQGYFFGEPRKEIQ
jgi:diguanylate cyclase (GGDEF)-like protein